MRYLVEVSYDGAFFHGYQKQPLKRTVQGEIEKVLTNMHKGQVKQIVASGRTDTGVHALAQTFHFDSDQNMNCVNWLRALNAQLPDDVVVFNVTQVPHTFHARYDVREKWYEYRIYNGEIATPFIRHYQNHVKQKLDIELMNKALSYLVGTHDFTAFCAAKSNTTGKKVRTIYNARIKRCQTDTLVFEICGNGFLYNMVRIIVGTLIEIGQRKKQPEVIAGAIEKKDRHILGKTAPAKGLYLQRVVYKNTHAVKDGFFETFI